MHQFILSILLILIDFASGDFASDHIRQHLNYSVSPCNDFYRHVCPKELPNNETVAYKSEFFYQSLAKQQHSRSLNNPIMNDIEEGRRDPNCTFDSNVYSELVADRCRNQGFQCYFDEFMYFYDLYCSAFEEVDDTVKFYAEYGNKTLKNPGQAIEITGDLIKAMMEDFENPKDFNSTISFYVRMQDRLYTMEVLNENDTSDHVGIDKINNLTAQLKSIINKKFEETPWMSEKGKFGISLLTQFQIILDDLRVETDFDKFDRNLTTLRKMNRDTTSRYFENSRRETGCKWFDVAHSFASTSADLDKLYSTDEEQLNAYRVQTSLAYNAFNAIAFHTILVLAPTFYPLNENSSDITMLAFAGDILGHEMYHSFLEQNLLNRSDTFKNEANCIMNNYSESCKLFAEGECKSGQKTFSEDGVDVEGLRAAYNILVEMFTPEQLQEYEYPDLNITRQQAFFYSHAMRSCVDMTNQTYDDHSPDNIRVNALVAQLPEFAAAFECQDGDTLYTSTEEICYLFGPKSLGNHAIEDKMNITVSDKDQQLISLLKRFSHLST